VAVAEAFQTESFARVVVVNGLDFAIAVFHLNLILHLNLVLLVSPIFSGERVAA
jgi:hypothetical protein